MSPPDVTFLFLFQRENIHPAERWIQCVGRGSILPLTHIWQSEDFISSSRGLLEVGRTRGPITERRDPAGEHRFSRRDLWRGRFASYPRAEPYRLTAPRYVEPKPVRARLANSPEAYPWSSTAARSTGLDGILVKSDTSAGVDGIQGLSPRLTGIGCSHDYSFPALTQPRQLCTR